MTELIIPILMFLGGIALLIYSVEKFIENLTKSALVLCVSTFILALFLPEWTLRVGRRSARGEK